jgi:hypothetical protein
MLWNTVANSSDLGVGGTLQLTALASTTGHHTPSSRTQMQPQWNGSLSSTRSTMVWMVTSMQRSTGKDRWRRRGEGDAPEMPPISCATPEPARASRRDECQDLLPEPRDGIVRLSERGQRHLELGSAASARTPRPHRCSVGLGDCGAV